MVVCFLSYNITGFACFWWMKCFINLFCMVYLCSSVLVLSDEAVVLYHGDRPAETGGRPGPRGSVPYHHWWSPREIRRKVWLLNSNILLTVHIKKTNLHVDFQWEIFQVIQTGYHAILSDFVDFKNWWFFRLFRTFQFMVPCLLTRFWIKDVL